MIPAFTVAQIRETEAAALARTPALELMKRAAGQVALAVTDRLGDAGTTGRRIVLLVGSGDNGGDALFAGALLRGRGAAVTAILLDPRRAHVAGLDALDRRRGRIADADSPAVPKLIDDADVIIDGIVGIGAIPPLRARAADLVRQVNSAGALRVAVDVPSGIDPDTGEVPGTDATAFRADVTVTFGGVKPGLLLADQYAGSIVVVDLDMAPSPSIATVSTLTDLDARQLLPVSGPADDKYSSGVLGVVAGSHQYPGAAVLATGGAVRLRPGMVRYAGPAAAQVLARWPEVVAGREPDQAGQVQAWLAGPGMGTDDDARRRLAQVLATDTPVLIDADGLTLLSLHPELLEQRRDLPTVLTPHDREFRRVFPDLDPSHRLESARAAAQRAGVTVLLKGHRTLVASADGHVRVVTAGSAWLATAGSGDVLSGVIGSLLAAGIEPSLAAAIGAHLHGRAGERAAADQAAGASALLDRLAPG